MRPRSLRFLLNSRNIFLRKLYLFYNIYLRNFKYLNGGSQFNEDIYLNSFFKKDYRGKFVDLGCFHPTRDNNTFRFYKKNWTGINLINTSRGPIVNEDDLIIALSTNEIAGAGLDVFEKEPLPENNKLRFLPNALLTPHIGYVTAENYNIYYNQMIEALESCVNNNPIRILK